MKVSIAMASSLSKFLLPTLVSLASYQGQIPKAAIRLRCQSAMAYCPQHWKERTLHLIEMRKVIAGLSILAKAYILTRISFVLSSGGGPGP